MLPGVSALSFLGYGLVRPFVRDQKGDFAAAEAEILVRACVGQLLGTRCSNAKHQGELPWRTDFGSLIFTLRHAPNDPVTGALAKTYIADALRKWEPRVVLRSVTFATEKSNAAVTGGPDVLVCTLIYDIVSNGSVIQANVNQKVRT